MVRQSMQHHQRGSVGVLGDGTLLPGQRRLNFAGAGVSVTDDPENEATLVTIPGGGTPAAHAASHKHGGADEIATATPSANAIPKAGGSGTLAMGWTPGVWIGRQVISNPTTTYTPTPGTKTIDVQGWGGGGGGGGTSTGAVSAAAGGGGAAGGKVRKRYTGISDQTTYAVAVGSGGLGGSTSGGDGASGGDTTFTDGTTLITAKGGGGGKGMSAGISVAYANGGTCPVSVAGDINGKGSPGAPGRIDTGLLGASGMGGSGENGSGGVSLLASGTGAPGLGIGGGGSGGLVLNGAAAAAGGAGSNGRIIIDEYA